MDRSLARVDGSRKESGVLYLFSARESSHSLVSRTFNQHKYYRSAFISQRLFHFRFTLEVQLTSVMTNECKFCFLTLLSHFGLLSHFAIMESDRQENTKNTDHLAFSLLSHFALSLGQK